MAISVDGQTMVVGYSGYWADASSLGYAKVYRKDHELWTQLGRTLNTNYWTCGTDVAVSMSADAKSLAICYVEYTDLPGVVQIYEWSEAAKSYEELGKPLKGEGGLDMFGYSLSFSANGTTLAIGAKGSDQPGYVKVYGRTEDAVWNLDDKGVRNSCLDTPCYYQQLGKKLTSKIDRDQFGESVSLSADALTLAVGASNKYDRSSPGYVNIFERKTGISNYTQLGQSISGDAGGGAFGSSVSLSDNGDILAVGSPDNDVHGIDSGCVQVYERDRATSNYKQLGQSLFGEQVKGNFGSQVSLSSNGMVLAIGADGDGGLTATSDGHVKVFAWDDVAYKQLGQSLRGEPHVDLFGNSLSLSGDGQILAIAAPHTDGDHVDSGEVKVFNNKLLPNVFNSKPPSAKPTNEVRYQTI